MHGKPLARGLPQRNHLNNAALTTTADNNTGLKSTLFNKQHQVLPQGNRGGRPRVGSDLSVSKVMGSKGVGTQLRVSAAAHTLALGNTRSSFCPPAPTPGQAQSLSSSLIASLPWHKPSLFWDPHQLLWGLDHL